MTITDVEKQIDWLVREGQQHLYASNCSSEWRELESWQKSLLEEQIRLRHRSRKRFPDPERWLWTDRSLSQASDWWSAGFKAMLIPPGATTIDACCGAGVDLVALAGDREVLGIDREPSMVRLAAANVEAHNLKATLRSEDFGDGKLPVVGGEHWMHIDPDRRASGAKTLRAADFSPDLDSALRAGENTVGSIIKISPRTLFSDELSARIDRSCTRAWLGCQGECRQQLLLTGSTRDSLIMAAKRQAVSVLDEAALREIQRWAIIVSPQTKRQTPDETCSAADPSTEIDYHIFGTSQVVPYAESAPVRRTAGVDDYVFDLHPVLRAAELSTAWAGKHELRAITSELGYFTGPQPLPGPWAQSFRVLDIVAWDDRKIRKLLRQLEAGVVEVKCRLHKIDTDHFQRRYSHAHKTKAKDRLSAHRNLTLIVTRFDQRRRCIVAERLPG